MSNGLTVKLFNMPFSRYSRGESKIVLAKYHENRLRIDREIDEKHAIQVIVKAIIHHINMMNVLRSSQNTSCKLQ